MNKADKELLVKKLLSIANDINCEYIIVKDSNKECARRYSVDFNQDFIKVTYSDFDGRFDHYDVSTYYYTWNSNDDLTLMKFFDEYAKKIIRELKKSASAKKGYAEMALDKIQKLEAEAE